MIHRATKYRWITQTNLDNRSRVSGGLSTDPQLPLSGAPIWSFESLERIGLHFSNAPKNLLRPVALKFNTFGGWTVADNLRAENCSLHPSKFSTGKHAVLLTANGVHTYFDLAPKRLTIK